MANIFKCIFFNENAWISIKISMQFVLKCPVNTTSVGSDNGLVLTRQQTIIWSNDDLAYQCIYTPLRPY